MLKLRGVAIILLLAISLSSADYTKDLEDTLLKQEHIIVKQDKKINKLESDKRARFIVRIPLTNWGITKDFALGYGGGFLTAIILL